MKSIQSTIADHVRATGKMLDNGQFKNSGEAWEHFATLLEKPAADSDDVIPPDLERMILLFLKEKRIYDHGKGVALTNGDGYMLAEIANHLARLKSSRELPVNIQLVSLKFGFRESDGAEPLSSEQ